MSAPKKPQQPVPTGGEIILYRTEDGQTQIQCRFEEEAIWLTQKLMAELFLVSVPTVNEHLKGIYEDGELTQEATIRKFRIVQTEGARQVEFYRLNANRSNTLEQFADSPITPTKWNRRGGKA